MNIINLNVAFQVIRDFQGKQLPYRSDLKKKTAKGGRKTKYRFTQQTEAKIIIEFVVILWCECTQTSEDILGQTGIRSKSKINYCMYTDMKM
jgi:hypothetical protein